MACNPATKSGNIGLAFGIVTAAGLSTTIGAALAFVLPRGHKNEGSRSTNLFLAASLGLASGVMLFVSFVEIYADKSVGSFTDCLAPSNLRRDGLAYLYATLCFFAGTVITYLFDIALHAFELWVVSKNNNNNLQQQDDADKAHDVENYAEDAQDDLVTDSNDADAIQQTHTRRPRSNSIPRSEQHVDIVHEMGHEGEMVATIYDMSNSDSRLLTRLGIFAGIALAFHNFPEGLATFIAVMDDPKVGASVAIAIAIHNIPEGICVSIPIYYATGSKWKAFFWATLSGISELFGAVLGLIIVKSIGGFSQNIYGVLFGIVAGMMVYISLKQLLPTAHKYDPDDRVTSASLCAGMVIMAISLVLFKF